MSINWLVRAEKNPIDEHVWKISLMMGRDFLEVKTYAIINRVRFSVSRWAIPLPELWLN